MCSCVPVWKGRGFLGENSERCTTVEGYQGGQGWGILRAGLASLLAICWVCSRRAFSSSSVVPEAQLVSEGRVRVPSSIDRSWWLMGSSEDNASPAGPSLSSLTPPGSDCLALTPSRRWASASQSPAPGGGDPRVLAPSCLSNQESGSDLSSIQEGHKTPYPR